MQEVERRTIAKLSWRLIPFLVVCYFIAYLDRVNVGFAALSMNKDLGLTQTMYGFGSGIFFAAYFLFEVPSNLLLERFGARRWIARIMVTWGVLSGIMAFIPQISSATGISNEYTFYGIRILLGVAEAGFFPGIIFFLTLWFPGVYRGRIIGLFMAAIPLSSVIGSPVSGYLLDLSGVMGLAGWQWLFIVEAIPALILAVGVLVYLTDKPADATWLAPEERNWLMTPALCRDGASPAQPQHVLAGGTGERQGAGPCRWCISARWRTSTASGFFLPTIVKGFGLSNVMTGVVTAIPLCGRLGGDGVVRAAVGLPSWSARAMPPWRCWWPPAG